jgi:hypothetical protein
MDKDLCWACLTGQCQNVKAGSIDHSQHQPPGQGDGGRVQAVTATGGTPLCMDCARWRSTSTISI